MAWTFLRLALGGHDPVEPEKRGGKRITSCAGENRPAPAYHAVAMFRAAVLAQLDRLRWTPYRLVQESGVSKTAVYAFLGGKRDISASSLERLCASLGLALLPHGKST